jgi:hypothetical protein
VERRRIDEVREQHRAQSNAKARDRTRVLETKPDRGQPLTMNHSQSEQQHEQRPLGHVDHLPIISQVDATPTLALSSSAVPDAGLLSTYAQLPHTYDELLTPQGRPRPGVASVLEPLLELDATQLARRDRLAALSLLNQGVTFSVYSDSAGTEKVFPFLPPCHA